MTPNRTKERTMPQVLNMDTLSHGATMALYRLDKSFIGTEDYMGLADFGNQSHKLVIRYATTYTKRLIHKKLIEAGLDPFGDSPRHDSIYQLAYKRQPAFKGYAFRLGGSDK